MAISLARAEAAMSTLRGCTASALFDAMKQSKGYLFSKHQTKKTALAAAQTDHETKGYFKKLVTKQVGSLAEYKQLTDRQRRHVQGLTAAKPQAKHFGQSKNIKTTQTEAMSGGEFADLINRILNSSALVGLYRANDHVEERFLYITWIPPGYVGRSIDEHESKSKGLDRAVIIVVAKPGGSPFILNMFPADQLYVGNQVALV